MNETLPAIEARGLSKRYGRNWALVGVDLRLPAGQALVVAGRNGSGKSTLLRVLAGSLRPDQGELRLLGEPVRRGRASLVGHASFTYDALSGMENLRITAQFLGRPSRREDLQPLLDRVGLGARGNDRVQAYSAGMRKRLSLARALLQDAPIVLLDEPYGQLDPPGFGWIDRLVHELREEGKTVVLASHQVERLSRLCDRALLLESGQRVWAGPASELPSAFDRLEEARSEAVAV
jgi:ABC-type multidrug transport system ATPase subunit